MCGVREDINNRFYLWLIKTDENGNEQWERTFGGDGMDNIGNSVLQTTDGGYVVCGQNYNIESNLSSLLIIKTDGNGNLTSTFEIPLSKTDRKLEKAINLQGQEVKYQTNQPIIEIYDDGTVEKKVIIE